VGERSSEAELAVAPEVGSVRSVHQRVHARVGHGHDEQGVLEPRIHHLGTVPVKHVPVEGADRPDDGGQLSVRPEESQKMWLEQTEYFCL
jgi:hypothetical protein